MSAIFAGAEYAKITIWGAIATHLVAHTKVIFAKAVLIRFQTVVSAFFASLFIHKGKRLF
jgi:hypothetical protein